MACFDLFTKSIILISGLEYMAHDDIADDISISTRILGTGNIQNVKFRMALLSRYTGRNIIKYETSIWQYGIDGDDFIALEVFFEKVRGINFHFQDIGRFSRKYPQYYVGMNKIRY